MTSRNQCAKLAKNHLCPSLFSYPLSASFSPYFSPPPVSPPSPAIVHDLPYNIINACKNFHLLYQPLFTFGQTRLFFLFPLQNLPHSDLHANGTFSLNLVVVPVSSQAQMDGSSPVHLKKREKVRYIRLLATQPDPVASNLIG
jgi:hypothetical protein